MTEDYIIDVKGLSKCYGDKRVVNQISLQVQKGEVFGFLGPNGSGKTTTIRMLCGLLTPDEGEGSCLGYDLLTQADTIKRYVGYMTQKFSFYTDLSVEENLDFMTRVYGMDNRQARIEKTLEEFNLKKRRDQLTGHLSGGWKQRLGLAACLIHKPKLLLLDEPTAGVDPIARREFWDKIHALSEEGITVFISTHYMDEAERCTRLAYLSKGELLITGTAKDIVQSTHLNTWQLKGDINTSMLKESKNIPGITQAALFGNKIHLCGFDVEEIEQELDQFAKKYDLKWQKIDPTLEDAYINLVENPRGDLK